MSELPGPFPPVTSVIPHRPPFLFIERVVALDRARVVAVRTFRADEPFLRGHFPDHPVVPAVVLVEGLAQAMAYHALFHRPAERILLVGIDHARFRSPVEVGAEITFEVHVGDERAGLTEGRGEVRAGGRSVASATLLGHAARPHQDPTSPGGSS